MVTTKEVLSRIVRRIDRNLEGPTCNFVEQFRYGHREILIAYSGHRGNIAIEGSIEHGYSPFGPSAGVPHYPWKRYLHLAWSSHTMERNSNSYPGNVLAIGAPFLYLAQLVLQNAQRQELPRKRKYLFIPPHGGEVDMPRIDSQIAKYIEDFDPKKTTVLMYWTEILDQRLVKPYLNAGFEVTTAGFCGMSLNEGLGISTRQRAMSGMGGRSRFLLQVLENLLTHDEVIAGTIGTSTIYAGYLRKKISLIEGWDNYDTSFVAFPGKYDMSSDPYVKFMKENVINQCFQNLESKVDSFHDFCSQELGHADLLEPRQLYKLIAENSFDIGSTHAVDELNSGIAELSRQIR